MAKLKTLYNTEDEIPEGYNDLYTERNGKWELFGIEGVKTPADVERVTEALRKEKADHKQTKELVSKFGDIDPGKAHEALEQVGELQAQLEALKKDGGFDENKVEPIISARVKQALGPIERDKAALQRLLDDQKKATELALGEVGNLKGVITSTSVERSIRDAAAELKVLATAIPDAVLHGTRIFEVTEDGRTITKDLNGITPGLTPKEWLKDQQERAPHWWPASVGGGARGGGPGGFSRTENPWSKEGWNMTKQGEVIKTQGAEKAAQIAAQAGSKIGATKPAAA